MSCYNGEIKWYPLIFTIVVFLLSIPLFVSLVSYTEGKIDKFAEFTCERMVLHDKITDEKYWSIYEEKCLT